MINKHVDLFTVEMVDSPSGLVPIVYCLDISTFLTLTLSERGIGVKDVVLRLSIDEGRGLTKISGSLIYKDPENEHDNVLSSSVKRIHILSIAPVKESYTMIEIMFQKLKIHEYPGDLDCFLSRTSSPSTFAWDSATIDPSTVASSANGPPDFRVKNVKNGHWAPFEKTSKLFRQVD